MKSINEIFEFLNIDVFLNEDKNITYLCLDSRKSQKDSAFIAIKGQATDGNQYIKDVLAKDVKLVLSDDKSNVFIQNQAKKELPLVIYVDNLKAKLASLARWFYDYKKPQSIIGVTGTNGKTSISNYIAQFLSLLGEKSLLLGTNGNGIYPDLKESSHTTLDILSLYQNISEHKQYHNLVMEVSSHSLDQNRVEGLNFDIAVFSNLSHEHLDYHKTMDNYFAAKAKLFQLENIKKAVVNIDDEYGKKLCEICNCEIVSVSLESQQADVYIKSKGIKNMQTIFDLYIAQKLSGTYQTSLIGDFNLINLGLSIGVLINQNFNNDLILAQIPKLKPVKGRMEIIELANKTKIIIDYAHTPDALEKALQTLRKYTKSKLWCIFGCGGNRDATKRPKMAAITEKYADNVVITEDNNRFEDIADIFRDIKQGFINPEQHKFIKERQKAIKYSIENAKVGDVILLAGKGHECYADKNGVKEYFNEREIIAEYDSRI